MLFNLKKIIAYQAIWRTPTILSNAYFCAIHIGRKSVFLPIFVFLLRLNKLFEL